MIRWAVLLITLLATSVQAQNAGLPAYYDVQGVASDDALNIRAEPYAGAAKMGALSYDARNVEVVVLSEDRQWAMIGMPEGHGWVALRYLERQDGQGDAFPAQLMCSGTEPFWGLELDGKEAVFSLPEDEAIRLAIDESVSAQGHSGRYGLILGGSDTGGVVVIRHEFCSDGMSDRSYGLSIDLMLMSPVSNALLSGCCRLGR